MVSTANLVACSSLAIDLAETSREIIGRSLVDGVFRHGEATLKEDRTFVTATDAAVEARLREIISTRFFDRGVIGDEHGEHGRGCSHVWVLDPIDGTAAFMAGIPVFGSLIACYVDGDPVIGVMDIPALDARFVGVAGEPTRLNGNVLKTRPCTGLAGAILSASSPDFFPPGDIHAFEQLRSRTAWRIYGAAALAYGRLAQGRSAEEGRHMSISTSGLAVSYGQSDVIADLDLRIDEGNFFTLLGPSGCGKTTLLRTIAGIVPAARGRILFGDVDVTRLPAHKRDIGMVFQDYALFRTRPSSRTWPMACAPAANEGPCSSAG